MNGASAWSGPGALYHHRARHPPFPRCIRPSLPCTDSVSDFYCATEVVLYVPSTSEARKRGLKNS